MLKEFQSISDEIVYDIIETSNDEILPLDAMSDHNQKLVIFDDYLNTGKKWCRDKKLFHKFKK